MITSLKNLYTHLRRCKAHEDQGHWQSLKPVTALGNEGFVYAIHCKTNGMLYIGKKTFKRAGKKTTKLNGKTIKNRAYGKDSGWRSYTSSSEHVNDHINEFGKDKFDFYHIHTCLTKGCLTYSECNILHVVHALTTRFEDGSRTFYNNQIGAIKYVPVTLQKSSVEETKLTRGFNNGKSQIS